MTVYEIEVTATVTVSVEADSPDAARAVAGWVWPAGWHAHPDALIVREQHVDCGPTVVREGVSA